LKTITKESVRYEKIITIHSPEKYDINKDELRPDERVVCPFDKDMFVSKDKVGEIWLIKGCYSKTPFL